MHAHMSHHIVKLVAFHLINHPQCESRTGPTRLPFGHQPDRPRGPKAWTPTTHQLIDQTVQPRTTRQATGSPPARARCCGPGCARPWRQAPRARRSTPRPPPRSRHDKRPPLGSDAERGPLAGGQGSTCGVPGATRRRAPAVTSAAATCASVSRCAYPLLVVASDSCPSRCCTTWGAAPAPSSHEADVCRSEWGVTSLVIPAAFFARAHCRSRKLFGWITAPRAPVNRKARASRPCARRTRSSWSSGGRTIVRRPRLDFGDPSLRALAAPFFHARRIETVGRDLVRSRSRTWTAVASLIRTPVATRKGVSGR